MKIVANCIELARAANEQSSFEGWVGMRKSIVIAVGYWVVMTGDAYAYLDPGTGTIILQGLVAGAATGLYFIRSHIRMVASFLTGRRKSRSEGDAEIDAEINE